ncbi:MAG TPA: 2-isopropylmalate synthase, partial [Candidatus Baltobacteraceae bacterium]|nr:2-isopropylmalate synthase [Candidatus Baltobacteraceae bacterium]
ATVEMATPNVYADQIEWFCRTVKDRNLLIVSTHPHNDRGTAVAAAELAQMAGAERVEGTLFGNGERTGNVDIVTLGLNLFSQGVDPGLDLREIGEVVRTVEYCNQMPVHARHPYGGELVFTAFSGSHQDAIKKGLSVLAREDSTLWEVPYLPIDPKDIGRTYEAVVRINSQSGKSGIAYVLESDHGIVAPRRLQIEFSRVIQEVADASGQEISSGQIYEVFAREYLAVGPGEFALLDQEIGNQDARDVGSVKVTLVRDEQRRRIVGEGHGPIEAFIAGIKRDLGVSLSVCDYTEHAAGSGADAIAWAYIEVEAQGTRTFGVGYDANIIRASLSAIVSALNRLSRSGVVRVEGEILTPSLLPPPAFAL